MNTLRSGDGSASERELLVDDIQRIRDVLHISAGHANKLSSDEEEGEGSEEEEEEQDEAKKNEEGSLMTGVTTNNSQHLNVNYVSPLNSKMTSPGGVFIGGDVGEQSPLSERKETVFIPEKCSSHVQEPVGVFPVQLQVDNNNLLPSQNTGNVSADEYILTELQPRNFQSPTSVPSTSQEGYNDASWLAEMNQFQGQNDANQQEEEEELFDNGDDEHDGNVEMRSEIQQCLSLNRDYQLAILDELERIELALAKNKGKQYGLQQIRAHRDDGKSEPQTLIKFANPYFKDESSMGPPDNDDTKIKRQNCQVGGYQVPSRCWNLKDKNNLAEGVGMQNLQNKLFPVLQKIQKLELKKEKTERELQELENLKAESSRIKNLPKDKLEHDLEAIDWDKISSTYVPKRSGFQCRLQWCNFGHPDVNRTPWTKEEDKKLLQLAKEPQNTWDVIAQKLQTKRTPIHSYERYQRSLNKNLLKSKWTPEDDQQLLEVVRIVGLGNWPRVASFLEGRQGDQCLHRYTQTLQMVRKGKWYKDEDELLKKAIEKYGPCNWNRLSEMVPGRSGPQCRERWVNALDPNIDKGAWSKEHDQKLLENVEKFGKGNWSKIARAIGTRTDNQCWRRWIVLRKDDFLYYRQNTLRKRRELVGNFTGRRQERPSLEAEDLDIPDVPVVRKRAGRVPRPIEESRARRRATRARFREKKRAEKREAEKREAEKRQAAGEPSTEMTPSAKQQRVRNTASDRNGVGKGKDDGQDGEEGSSESNKIQRLRKTGGNRIRVQQPHHRVLMQTKQLSKRKKVAEKREKRHIGTSTSGEKQVTVSGSLGPFSLLLQAFSIDIPTVLQAIQKTPTTSSTSPPSSGTNITADAGHTTGGEKMSSGDQQSTQLQPSNGIGNQGSQQTNVSGEYSNSLSEAPVRDVTSDRQTTPELQNQDKAQKSNKAASPVEEKSCESERHQATNTTDVGSTDGATPGPSTNTDRVGAGNESTAVSSTNQAARRRAPAIPALPPCFTTLKTFKSLQLLRPHLQQIAAMLNTVTAGSLACQPSSTAGATGSHSNMVPSVTSASENEARYATQEPRDGTKDVAPEKNIDNVSKSCGSETRLGDHVVSPGSACDTEGSNVLESGIEPPPSTVTEGRLSIGDSRLGKEGVQPAAGDKTVPGLVKTSELPSLVTNNGGEAISSSRDSSRVQACSVSSTVTRNKESNSLSSARAVDGRAVEARAVDGRSVEVRAVDGRSVDARAVDGRSVDARAVDGRSVEARAVDGRSVDARAVDNRVRDGTTVDVRVADRRVADGSQQNAATVASGIRNTSYRNSYEYKLLSSRFNSLFLWPALLSKIPPVKSQIGSVFAERHPPPNGGGGENAVNSVQSAVRKRKPAPRTTDPFKRKRPGLAAVRMASSASLSTPGQQMCIVGQGSAIRKEAPERQPDDPSTGSKEAAFAASQLIPLQETSRSLNTRKSRRKGTPVKRQSSQKNSTRESKRRKFLESSDSSSFSFSSSSSESDDNSLEIDYSPAKAQRSTRETRPLTRAQGAVQLTSSIMATGSADHDNPDGIISRPVVISADSDNESQPALQDVQADTDARPAPGEETADQQSSAAVNQSLSKKNKLSKNNLPSSSSKRKNPSPVKNRGARWRAMLPKVDSEESDD